jgi:hypothetical protein
MMHDITTDPKTDKYISMSNVHIISLPLNVLQLLEVIGSIIFLLCCYV